MSSENAHNAASSPPQFTPPVFGRIRPPVGFIQLNEDASPMVTHGSGALASLIKNRSTTSLHTMKHRRPSSLRDRDTPDVEDERSRRNSGELDEDDFRRTFQEERRLSTLLLGPQMRSQRLIGNSNPRYKWGEHISALVALCRPVCVHLVDG